MSLNLGCFTFQGQRYLTTRTEGQQQNPWSLPLGTRPPLDWRASESEPGAVDWL